MDLLVNSPSLLSLWMVITVGGAEGIEWSGIGASRAKHVSIASQLRSEVD